MFEGVGESPLPPPSITSCQQLSYISPPPVFQKLRGDQALFQKAVYLLGNVMAVGLGLYKVNSMGLLPTAQSDWLEFMEDRQVGTEYWLSF